MVSRDTFIGWIRARLEVQLGLPRPEAAALANACLANFVSERQVTLDDQSGDWDEAHAHEIADDEIAYWREDT